MKILVIDDVALHCLLIQKTLTQYGYTVLMASSGEEALRLLNGNLDESGIAAVICDLMMPDMDGVDFLRRCQQNAQKKASCLPPFILLTASTDEASHAIAREAGYQLILTKPVEPVHLHAKLSELLA